jgi:acid phosphatase family membrane protein YuiD
MTKVLVSTVKAKKFCIKSGLETGGMPSAHTAFIVSVTIMIGLEQGFLSPLFALATAITAIVMHDSVKVRYAVGEYGEALNSLIKERKSNVRQVKIVKGHKSAEVAAGTLLGMVVALAVFYYI